MTSSNKSSKRCVTVIPIYRKEFHKDEEMCVKKYVQVLDGEDIVFVGPESLDTSYYEKTFPMVVLKRFSDRFFKGINGYNHLMLDPKFYRSFSDHEYMLIAQPDAVIFREDNMLEEFMNLGYDYYGAPWIPPRHIWEWAKIKDESSGKVRTVCLKKRGNGITMGNGGFSLRRIESCARLIEEYGWRKIYWFIKRNEDIFFGVFGRANKCGFKLCDVENGKRFALEYNIRESVENGKVPFGVHGWSKEFDSFEEMEKYLEDKKVWTRSL